jgi:UPF0755 protein
MTNRRIGVKTLSSGVVLLLFSCAVVLLIPSKLTDFPQGSEGPEVIISVAEGENGSAIAIDLAKQGVILSSKTFTSLATSDPSARGISPGNHRIQSHIPSKVALSQLLDSARNSGVVKVIEGTTLSDVLLALKKALITGAIGSHKLPTFLGRTQSLEGTLFPASYAFASGTSVHDAVTVMINHFEKVALSSGVDKGYGSYSPYDLVKVASLLQIEGDPSDYSKVARVIYNRLKIGMPLQLNSTVQYANNTRGKIALSRNATQIRSPYNTYLHTGLPPTPISNPGLQAISAAQHPADGDWLYFITVKPHDTRFTKSFAEFQDWVTLYNKNLALGAFR